MAHKRGDKVLVIGGDEATVVSTHTDADGNPRVVVRNRYGRVLDIRPEAIAN